MDLLKEYMQTHVEKNTVMNRTSSASSISSISSKIDQIDKEINESFLARKAINYLPYPVNYITALSIVYPYKVATVQLMFIGQAAKESGSWFWEQSKKVGGKVKDSMTGASDGYMSAFWKYITGKEDYSEKKDDKTSQKEASSGGYLDKFWHALGWQDNASKNLNHTEDKSEIDSEQPKSSAEHPSVHPAKDPIDQKKLDDTELKVNAFFSEHAHTSS